jgi:hypothetical protein
MNDENHFLKIYSIVINSVSSFVKSGVFKQRTKIQVEVFLEL